MGFGEAGTLSLNRAVNGEYATDFLVTNPECSSQLVSFSVQVLDRNRERLEVRPTVARIDRIPAEAGTTPADLAASDGEWQLGPGEADLFRLTIAGVSASGAAPGASRLAWAALRSAPMDYGYWTRHLPVSGILILTRHSGSGEIKAGDDEDKTGGASPALRWSAASRDRCCSSLRCRPVSMPACSSRRSVWRHS